jgi:hypothetical protein
MKNLITLLAALMALSLNAQNCNCKSNFEWAKETFEKNDAGFQYAISKKGNDAYQQHNQIFLEKVESITDYKKCMLTLYQWMKFFRSGHIGIKPLKKINNKKESEAELIAKYKDWEKIDINIEQFKDYLNKKETIDFEGIWDAVEYKIGIKKIDTEFVGFIIESDGVYWSEKQVKLRIKADNSAIYYMKDHSFEKFEIAELLGNNYLEMGFVTLKRINPTNETEKDVKRYFNALYSNKPYIEKLNTNTLYLRIPSFRNSKKKYIDSLITANESELLKTPNLIIDLRNNSGGSDRSYKKLLPIIYTNPIRTVGAEFLSTELNNQRMLSFANDTIYGFEQEFKKWAKKSYDKLSANIGEFVSLDSTIVDITTFDKTHIYPKNIGIIINNRNASTTEQFLLAAKQSKKVKLFGTTTVGALDMSNMYFVKSPNEDFELGYTLSKSGRIPNMSIDEKGIQPDYYIDRTIPKYKWINYVIEIMGEK